MCFWLNRLRPVERAFLAAGGGVQADDEKQDEPAIHDEQRCGQQNSRTVYNAGWSGRLTCQLLARRGHGGQHGARSGAASVGTGADGTLKRQHLENLRADSLGQLLQVRQ